MLTGARVLISRSSPLRLTPARLLRPRSPLTINAMNAAMMSSARLFSFVEELADDKPALVQRCKETLRTLGGDDAYVKLHLPGSRSDAATTATNNTSGNTTIVNALQHCAVIEIHNPAARNALSGRMMAQLADIVTQLEDPDIHKSISAIVLRGTGGWFCAGADLRVAKEELSSRQGGSAMGAVMVDTLTRFRRLPIVSVAVVEGGAYGGGAELSTSCDFRMLADNAVIQFVQARMGVSPGWGGGARLYKIVGRQHALRLLCTAEKLTPARAVELGLVDSVYKNDGPGSCEAACIEFLQPFDVVSPEVSHGAKQVITNADDVSLDEVLEFEHRVFTRLWGGPANIKALEGALRKSKPAATE